MKFNISIPILFFCLISNFAISQDWEKTFVHETGLSQAFDVIETSDNGYVIAGEVDLPTGAIRHYIWLAKTDQQGNELWSNIYDGGDVMLQEAKAIAEDNDGNLLVAGSDFNTASVLKTNMDGDSLWTKHFGGQGTSGFQDIIRDENGNFILVGARETEVSSSLYNIWIMGMNTEGDSLWSAQYFESSSYWSSAMDISPLSNNQFLVTGNTNGQSFCIKINGTDGSQEWSNTYQIGTDDHLLSSSVYNGGANLLLGGTDAGFAGYSPTLFTTNAIGEYVNPVNIQTVYFGAVTSIAPTDDAGFILTGSSYIFHWNQPPDVGFIIKLNNNLEVEWELDYHDNPSIQGASIRQTTDGSYLIAGNHQNGMWLKKITGNPTSNEDLISHDFMINLFPNPVGKNIQLEIPESIKMENISLTIYDNLGRLIKNQLINNRISSIQVSEIPSGIYFYSIQNSEKQLKNGKIILE